MVITGYDKDVSLAKWVFQVDKTTTVLVIFPGDSNIWPFLHAAGIEHFGSLWRVMLNLTLVTVILASRVHLGHAQRRGGLSGLESSMKHNLSRAVIPTYVAG